VEIAIWIWITFTAFVLAMVALDRGLFHRNAHKVPVRARDGHKAKYASIRWHQSRSLRPGLKSR